MTPGSFWRIRALERSPSGTVASVVLSPEPTSSASAAATSWATWSGSITGISDMSVRNLRGALEQVGADEPVQVALEHALDVADLLVGPVVLDHRVRIEHVGPDLRAEVDVL